MRQNGLNDIIFEDREVILVEMLNDGERLRQGWDLEVWEDGVGGIKVGVVRTQGDAYDDGAHRFYRICDTGSRRLQIDIELARCPDCEKEGKAFRSVCHRNYGGRWLVPTEGTVTDD